MIQKLLLAGIILRSFDCCVSKVPISSFFSVSAQGLIPCYSSSGGVTLEWCTSNSVESISLYVVFTQPYTIRKVSLGGGLAFTAKSGDAWLTSPSNVSNPLEINDGNWLPYDLTGKKILVHVPSSVDNITLGIFGCPATQTLPIGYTFNASESSINAAFVNLENFAEETTQKIQSALGKGKVVFSGMKFGADLTAPTMDISLRVLPDANSSSLVVKDWYNACREDPDSALNLEISSLGNWVEDNSAHMCYNKVCPKGQLCVDGKCADSQGVVHGPAEPAPPEPLLPMLNGSFPRVPYSLAWRFDLRWMFLGAVAVLSLAYAVMLVITAGVKMLTTPQQQQQV